MSGMPGKEWNTSPLIGSREDTRSALTCSKPVQALRGDEGRRDGMLLEPGQVLASRYRIERRLGRYGASNVYKAYDGLLRESVALKAVALTGPNTNAQHRLRSEARLLRRINHPNVLRVHDIGVQRPGSDEHDGVYFLTMQLIRGRPLNEYLQAGPLSLPAILAIARQILAGLSAAHALNVAHHRLTAETILVRSSSLPIITIIGFGSMGPPTAGCATPDDQGPTFSQTAEMERDVEAFGRLLFEMLMLRGASDIDEAPASLGAIDAARALHHRADPGIARTLDAMMQRCVDRQRPDRFDAAGQVLAAWMQSEPA